MASHCDSRAATNANCCGSRNTATSDSADEREAHLPKPTEGPMPRIPRLQLLDPLWDGDQRRVEFPHQLSPVAGAELVDHLCPAEVERHTLAATTVSGAEPRGVLAGLVAI